MQVHRDPNNLPVFKNPIITIGSFDGVHKAHLKILDRVITLADEMEGESILVTFHPHPRQIIFPKDDSLQLLNSLEEKIFILNSVGIDHLVIVPFSVEFSQQNPREYIEKFIIGKFHPKYVVIGYDHRFGLNRAGNIDLLRQYSDQFHIIEIQRQELEDITISSTKIRIALNEGNIDTANSYLIRPYIIQGKVVHGDKIGKSLGFPTANIKVSEKTKLIPKEGIYACHVTIEEERYQGMLYIGKRPTLSTDKADKRIEVNIFDFKDEIYGQDIRLEIIKYIRDDMYFDDLSKLSDQLALDEIATKEVFEIKSAVKPKKIKATVAILNYNGKDYLESYLPSVSYSSEHDFNTLVIDNASHDESVKYLSEWHPEVDIHLLTKNYGFAEGYNRGLKHIKSKYLVLINSDVRVTNNWIDPIIEMMDADRELAVVQPKILSLETPNTFEYAGACGGWLDYLGYPLCRGRIFDHIEKDEGQYDDIADVFWASGAAMVIRTDLFKALGGFDKDYFAHMEEVDFCWRLKRAGYKIKVCPTSKVYHMGGGTLSYESPHKTFLNFRNNINTLMKNESIGSLLWKLPIRLILDGVAGLKFMIQGNPKGCFAILKAHFAVYKSINSTLMKRSYYNRLIRQKMINLPNKAGRLNKSIVFQYFILGKKKFSQILKSK